MSEFVVDIDTDKMTEQEYTEWRIAVIDEQVRLKCLDMELYDILIMLNSKGYYTSQSCAGHSPEYRGWIEFATSKMSKTEYHGFAEGIYYLLQELGLKDIHVSRYNGKEQGKFGRPDIRATFEPMGIKI